MKSSQYAMDEAIRAWKRGDYQIKRRCVEAFQINYDTFNARLAGRQPRRDRRPPNCRLTPIEESAVIRFMLSLDAVGIGGGLRTIASTAMHILRQRPNCEKDPDPITTGGPPVFVRNIGSEWDFNAILFRN
jgi:hypothetical protein